MLMIFLEEKKRPLLYSVRTTCMHLLSGVGRQHFDRKWCTVVPLFKTTHWTMGIWSYIHVPGGLKIKVQQHRKSHSGIQLGGPIIKIGLKTKGRDIQEPR